MGCRRSPKGGVKRGRQNSRCRQLLLFEGAVQPADDVIDEGLLEERLVDVDLDEGCKAVDEILCLAVQVAGSVSGGAGFDALRIHVGVDVLFGERACDAYVVVVANVRVGVGDAGGLKRVERYAGRLVREESLEPGVAVRWNEISHVPKGPELDKEHLAVELPLLVERRGVTRGGLTQGWGVAFNVREEEERRRQGGPYYDWYQGQRAPSVASAPVASREPVTMQERVLRVAARVGHAELAE